MKKVIVRVDLHDDRDKLKVMKRVCYIPGVDSISMDIKDKKLTVIGDIDPTSVVRKLRRTWDAQTIFFGPAEPVNKEEPKEVSKKVELKSEEVREDARREDRNRHVSHAVSRNQPSMPSYQVSYPQNYAHSMEEDPNACVIC